MLCSCVLNVLLEKNGIGYLVNVFWIEFHISLGAPTVFCVEK